MKPEYASVSLRTRCYPMAKPDQEEIERQVEELVRCQVVNEYVGHDFL